MKTTNIPLKDKFDSLIKGLTEILPVAEELSRDPVHSQSPHIGAVVGRLRGSIESSNWHVKALADLPDPAPADPQPKTKTAADAKASAPSN